MDQGNHLGETEEEWSKEYKRRMDKYFSTKGHKKIWNYFLAIRQTDEYQSKIKNWREWYQIPAEGFTRGSEPTDSGMPSFKWKFYNTQIHGKLLQEVKNFCKKYSLHPMDFSEVIENELFFNECHPIWYVDAYNLFRIEDLVEQKNMSPEDRMPAFEEADDIAYPIAIRISPYASQQDTIDYIQKNFNQIKEYQKPYIKDGIKIGKVRTRNPKITERNNLIYQNAIKGMTIKQIRRLLVQKGDILDDGLIGKVISLEKKKRKKV